jgi:mevalonate kinase
VAKTKEFGVTSKLTGAGGGGCIIGFCPKSLEVDSKSLKEALELLGATLIENVSMGQCF